MIEITEEEAEQLVADSLVLQKVIEAELISADTAARLQLSIDPGPWLRAHDAERPLVLSYRVTFSPDAVDPAGCLTAAPGVLGVELIG